MTKQSIKPKKETPASKARDRIVKRAALEFKDGMYGKIIQVNDNFYSSFELFHL